jgi:hypothetical protein
VKKARVGGAGQKEKRAIVALVERSGDEVRGFHVPNVNRENLARVLFGNIAKDTHVMTDEATRYWKLGETFAKHSSVNHSRKEYVRGGSHHEHRGRLLLDPQRGSLAFTVRERTALATLRRRIQLPLQQPRQAWR